jgi:N6-adenosine-specific RNA methylase IME4
MQEWGFRYSAIAFTWVKLKRDHVLTGERDLHVGLGYTTRKNTELCLLARRGSPKRRSTKVRELIVSPRREHSRKPDEIHERIEQYCAGPYVELFARSSRKGWRTWGAEATKFDEPLREAAE